MANDFKPDKGRKVTWADAKSWIDKYDKEHRKEKDKDTKSVFYGKDALRAMLDTEGAAGVSIFLALKHSEHAGKETVTLVLVPTKEDGTLIFASEGAGKDGDLGYAWDDGMLCPPVCPTGNG